MSPLYQLFKLFSRFHNSFDNGVNVSKFRPCLSISKFMIRVSKMMGFGPILLGVASLAWLVLLHQVMLSREDLVVSIHHPDGSLSAEHADGTRITTLYQDRPLSTPQYILLHTGNRHKVHTHCGKYLCSHAHTATIQSDLHMS